MAVNEIYKKAINVSLATLFRRQAEQNPDKAALIRGGKSITYRQLNDLSDMVAGMLINHNIKRNDVVAVAMGNDERMAISILGVLKANCIYMPVDLKQPENSIKYMLDDACPTAILVGETSDQQRLCEYNTLFFSDIKCVDKSLIKMPLDNEVGPACIIYTSGSTGNPKGVLISHIGIENYILWRIKNYGISDADNILQLLHPAFDGYWSNLYTSLLSGSTMFIYEDVTDYENIGDYIKNNKITHFSVVPAIFNEILRFSKSNQLFTIRSVVLGGEIIQQGLLEKSFIMLPQTSIYNEYGLTETAIAVTSAKIKTCDEGNLIGKPIDGVKIKIVDEKGIHAKEGEILIGGCCLALGYINDPVLTHSRFVSDHLPDSTLFFKTGDYGILTDKGIQYTGRLDMQAKIDGYRIEVEDIIRCISSHPEIDDVRVMVCNNSFNDAVLCAFIVYKSVIAKEELRNFLGKLLPRYMIPEVYIELPRIPLLSNGKTDYSELQEKYKSYISEKCIVPIMTDTEKLLVRILSEILDVTNISTEVTFFELGGNSLLLMQFYRKIQKIFTDKIKVTDIFSYPTIAELALYIDSLIDDITE